MTAVLCKMATIGMIAGIVTTGTHAFACPPDSVPLGTTCVDKYEASVWKIPPANTPLINHVQAGAILSAGELAGATRKGDGVDDYDPGCTDDAGSCTKFYAVSIPGVKPSIFLTWYQALAACRNSGKRLLTNQEWQMAALGTPDVIPVTLVTDCNIIPTGGILATGASPACVSSLGAYDMVGNVAEWVADWAEQAVTCGSTYGSDLACIGGNAYNTANLPAALVRGGSLLNKQTAGAHAVNTVLAVKSLSDTGFRCAR